MRGLGSGSEITEGLRLAALADRPLLLAVDYAAEHGATQLRALLDQLCAHGPARWRLLLLARHIGDWWNGDTRAVLPTLQAAGVEVAGEPLPLPELVTAGEDRQGAYEFILSALRPPVTAFADQRGLRVNATPPTPPLQRPEYGSALMLHLAAVCALLPAAGPGTRPADRLDPTKVVDRFLDLERDHHWLYRDGRNLHPGTAQAFGSLAEGEAGRYLVETAVTAATLTGAAHEAQAGDLTTTALGVGAHQAKQIAYWLRDLYPPPTEASTGSILHPLQPDLLGEELVARVLRRQLDSGLPPDQLLPFTLIATSSEAQAQRMLTVLIRAAERHAWIAELLTDSHEDEPTSKQRGLLSCVPFDTDLSTVENALPWQNTYLLRVSVQLIQRLFDRFDHFYGEMDTSTTEIAAKRARLSDHLGIRLSNVGRREEALAATTEAVEIRRRLAGVNSAAFEPDLARGLWNFAWVRAAGQVELPEALDAVGESVAIYERLVERLPQAFSGDLRGVLATLAEVFEGLGRDDEAVQVRDRIERLG